MPAVPPRDAMNRLRRLYACGMVAAGSDPTAAALTLEQVCEEADRLEHRLDGLWAGIDLARIAAAQEREHAATLLRDVAAGADSIGAALIRDVAEHELRRLGVRTWRRGATASPGALTKREQEVAELVARGASNPEIAEALFLSRKTVERHVSNVLAKVGARNRVELAGMLAREAQAPRR